MEHPRGYAQLTPEERAEQIQHILRKLRHALDYVVLLMWDDLGHGNGTAKASFTFSLQGVKEVSVKVSAIRLGGAIKIMVYAVQDLDSHPAGPFPIKAWPLRDYSSALGDLFQSYSPLQVVTTHDPCPYFTIAPPVT